MVLKTERRGKCERFVCKHRSSVNYNKPIIVHINKNNIRLKVFGTWHQNHFQVRVNSNVVSDHLVFLVAKKMLKSNGLDEVEYFDNHHDHDDSDEERVFHYTGDDDSKLLATTRGASVV